MNNIDKSYQPLLQDILDNHDKYSNEELENQPMIEETINETEFNTESCE